jgi:hypothetical protein
MMRDFKQYIEEQGGLSRSFAATRAVDGQELARATTWPVCRILGAPNAACRLPRCFRREGQPGVPTSWRPRNWVLIVNGENRHEA